MGFFFLGGGEGGACKKMASKGGPAKIIWSVREGHPK